MISQLFLRLYGDLSFVAYLDSKFECEVRNRGTVAVPCGRIAIFRPLEDGISAK